MTDRLQSNVLTVQPDGTISADFTGTVNALGLTLPAATVPAFVARNEIAWQNEGGAFVATIGASDQGSGGGRTLRVATQGDGINPGYAYFGVNAAAAAQSGSVEVSSTPGAAPGLLVRILARIGTGGIVLYADDGSSDLLQKAQNLADVNQITARANLGLGQAGGAYLSANRAITATGVQPIQADTSEAAPLNNNLISTAGWRQYQCPRTGVYLVLVRATLTTSANSWFNANVYKNGTRYSNADQQQTVSAGQSYTISGALLVPANAGDLLEGGISVGALNATTLSGGLVFTGWQALQIA